MPIQPPARKSSGTMLFLYFASIFLWAFDYKAETSGAGFFVQLPILAFHVMASAAIIFIYRRGRPFSWWPRLLAAGGIFFLVCSSLVGIVDGQPLWDVAANSVPLLVLISASLSTYAALSGGIDASAFRARLQKACLVFMVIHFAVAVIAGRGIDLATSRYQYLSGAVIPACAVLTMGFFLRFEIRQLMLSAVNLTIILIAVTRTELAVIAGQLMSAFIAWPPAFLRPSSLKKIIAAAALLAAIVGGDIGAGTGLTERWIERLTVRETTGADPTALTRAAETGYMMRQFAASPAHMLIGNGLAARTRLIGREAALAAAIAGQDSVEFQSIGFGHNNYASLLFIGGMIAGGPLLALIFFSGVHSFILMRRLLKNTIYPESLASIGLWGSLITLGMMVEAALSPTFGDRTTCLWYGIGLGMLYWARDEAGKIRKAAAPLLKRRADAEI